MRGWIEHVKRYVPGLSNLNEKLSFVSMPPDLNIPVSLTAVCGSSSMLVQVTVEPALTVRGVGLNMKSLMMIFVVSGVSAVDGIETSIPPRIIMPAAVSSHWVRLIVTQVSPFVMRRRLARQAPCH